MIAANHVYKAAKPDGLTLGHFVGSLFMRQLLGRPQSLTRPSMNSSVRPIPVKTACALTKASGISNMDHEARQLIQVGTHDAADIARPFVMPPGTPNDRVQIMRSGCSDVKEPAVLSEADKSKLEVDPVRVKRWKKSSSPSIKPIQRRWPN